MHNCWVYITYGLQDKASFMHPRMRYCQLRRFKNVVFEKNDIQVDDSRPVPDRTGFASHPLLHRLHCMEQVQGCQVCFDLYSRIEKPVLSKVVHGRSPIKRGSLDQRNRLTAAQSLYGQTAVLQQVTKIGSDGYICPVCHAGFEIAQIDANEQGQNIQSPASPYLASCICDAQTQEGSRIPR